MSPTGGSINRLGGSQYECRGQIGGTGDVSLQGLRGVALEFANTLPAETQDNFQQFSAKLADRFPPIRKEIDELKVWGIYPCRQPFR